MKLTAIIQGISDRLRLSSKVTALTGGTRTVDGVVITNGGSGYTSAPTVGFSGGGGSGAAGTAVVSGGQVISVTVTAGGTGYTSTPSVGFTLGGGTGAAATAQMLALDFDAIPTLGISLTYGFFSLVLVGNEIYCFTLRSSTEATAAPRRVRPTDYAGTTNEKVWFLTAIFPDAARIGHNVRTYAASLALDFLSGGGTEEVSLTGDITLTTSNLAAGRRKTVIVIADGTPRNFTLPAWVFVGSAAPASIAASKTAVFELWSRGTTDANVVARYTVQP